MSEHEFSSRQFLPKEKSIREMKLIVMNNSIWTTTSSSLSGFEFSHFCRYFSILFDSYRHSLLKTKSMPEIKDMYDQHPSIKSITSITVITRRVVSIDFYRLIDTIDNVYVIDIDSYRFMERFSDIAFYRLPRSGLPQ